MKPHKSPRAAIKAHCVDCNGGCKSEVCNCDGDASKPKHMSCLFHPFRLGKGRPSKKVIRQFCLQCMGGSHTFVRECATEDCCLHPYRMGKNPSMARCGKSAVEMSKIRVPKTHFVKEISIGIERSDNDL